MTIFILSRYKIQALEDKIPTSNFLAEDIVDILTHKHSKVVESKNLAYSLFETNPNYHYIYNITVELESKR